MSAYDMECPVCDHSHDMGNYPDHWMGGARRFDFECESCGAKFWVAVEWEPEFIPDDPPEEETQTIIQTII